MAIFVTGDTHGTEKHGYFSVDGYPHRLSMDSFPEQKEMGKEDYIVILGDFGGIWDYAGESKEEKYWLDWLDGRSFTTLFVPGNHENYDRLVGINEPARLDSWLYKKLDEGQKKAIRDGYPQKCWHGGKVREIRPSVLMLERGYVFDIDGCSCFSFGGAASHDVQGGIFDPLKYDNAKAFNLFLSEVNKRTSLPYRVLGVSWWPQEIPSQEEMDRGIEELEKHGNQVDFIFSHDAPTYAKVMLGYRGDINGLNVYLEKVAAEVQYKKWFFGHYHENRMVTPKDLLLYEQIIQIH